MHLVYPPNCCITIVSNFFWVLQSFQEKSMTMVMQNFAGKTRCIIVYVKWWIQNDQKLITVFWSYECLQLTGPEVIFGFDVWELLEIFCLVLRLCQVRLPIYPDIAFCCIRFNWNGHCGMLPRVALRGKLVQSLNWRHWLYESSCRVSTLVTIHYH